MKKRRLFLLLLLFTIGISIPQATQAAQKETAVSIQFAQENDEKKSGPIIPKDQLPGSEGSVTPISNEFARKTLPQTGEILSFTSHLIGIYLIGFLVLILLLKRNEKEENYG